MSVYSTSGTAPFDTFLGNVTHDLDPQCIDKKMIFHPYDPYLVVSDSTVVKYEFSDIVLSIGKPNVACIHLRI
jgi:hypothetical protein